MENPIKSTRAAHQGEFVIQHRNPLGRGFLVVSRSLLYGYPSVSDSAKLTYWVIYDHDWNVPEQGGRKGYAYPTVARIARLRRTTDRTIQRHLTELIGVHLLTRDFRPGKANILYIEDPAAVLATMPDSSRGDKNVGGGVTKMSPHKQEEENQEKHINGNENQKFGEERRRGRSGLMSIADLLQPRRRLHPRISHATG
jgi:hypothetical protein